MSDSNDKNRGRGGLILFEAHLKAAGDEAEARALRSRPKRLRLAVWSRAARLQTNPVRLARRCSVFFWLLDVLVPERIRNENIGDAREKQNKILSDRRISSWQKSSLVVTHVFATIGWTVFHTALYVVNAWRGKKTK